MQEVYLDGVRQPLCVRADTRLRYVEIYSTDAAGDILRDVSGKAETEKVFGERVEIRTVND